jgi:hypothetical protein
MADPDLDVLMHSSGAEDNPNHLASAFNVAPNLPRTSTEDIHRMMAYFTSRPPPVGGYPLFVHRLMPLSAIFHGILAETTELIQTEGEAVLTEVDMETDELAAATESLADAIEAFRNLVS